MNSSKNLWINYFEREYNLDLVFLCKDNVKVVSHKVVLASVSELLKCEVLLNLDDIVHISLPDVEATTVKTLLQLLYEGSSTIATMQEIENLKEVIALLGIHIPSMEINLKNSIENDTASTDEMDLQYMFNSFPSIVNKHHISIAEVFSLSVSATEEKDKNIIPPEPVGIVEDCLQSNIPCDVTTDNSDGDNNFNVQEIHGSEEESTLQDVNEDSERGFSADSNTDFNNVNEAVSSDGAGDETSNGDFSNKVNTLQDSEDDPTSIWNISQQPVHCPMETDADVNALEKTSRTENKAVVPDKEDAKNCKTAEVSDSILQPHFPSKIEKLEVIDDNTILQEDDETILQQDSQQPEDCLMETDSDINELGKTFSEDEAIVPDNVDDIRVGDEPVNDNSVRDGLCNEVEDGGNRSGTEQNTQLPQDHRTEINTETVGLEENSSSPENETIVPDHFNDENISNDFTENLEETHGNAKTSDRKIVQEEEGNNVGIQVNIMDNEEDDVIEKNSPREEGEDDDVETFSPDINGCDDMNDVIDVNEDGDDINDDVVNEDGDDINDDVVNEDGDDINDDVVNEDGDDINDDDVANEDNNDISSTNDGNDTCSTMSPEEELALEAANRVETVLDITSQPAVQKDNKQNSEECVLEVNMEIDDTIPENRASNSENETVLPDAPPDGLDDDILEITTIQEGNQQSNSKNAIKPIISIKNLGFNTGQECNIKQGNPKRKRKSSVEKSPLMIAQNGTLQVIPQVGPCAFLAYSPQLVPQLQLFALNTQLGIPAGLTTAGLPTGITTGLPAGLTPTGLTPGLTTTGLPAGLATTGLPAGLNTTGLPAGLTTTGLPAGLATGGVPTAGIRLPTTGVPITGIRLPSTGNTLPGGLTTLTTIPIQNNQGASGSNSSSAEEASKNDVILIDDDDDDKDVTEEGSSQDVFPCSFCGITFSSAFFQLEHSKTCRRKTDNAFRPYYCEICNNSFVDKFRLDRHVRLHSVNKPYRCSVCAMGFIELSRLHKHMLSHSGEKPYVCTICNTSFCQKHTLKAHMRIHTGEKPFKCAVCSMSFIRRENFLRHVRNHTGEEPYKCTKCNMGFRYPGSLTYHKKICR